MKKPCVFALCALLCAALLCGCLPGGGAPRPAAPFSAPQSPAGSQAPPEARRTGSLTVALPVHLSVWGDALAELALQDGITLQVRTAPSGGGYAAGVKAMLAGQNAPAVVWLADDEDAQTLGGRAVLADLAREAPSPVFSALAQMTPAQGRLLQDNAVYGLPLGSYAEGYLVNMEVLCALLGTDNPVALRRDLAACTFAQFSALAAALEQYLARPGRMRLAVGGTVYQTPDYRPGVAQSLRGIFAVPDADAAALMQTALDAAASLARRAEEEKPAGSAQDAAGEVLTSLLGLLDLETMHMGRREGAMRRGEDYTALGIALSAEDARQQFAQGAALFWRASSRDGFALMEENPALSAKLALAPLKFPPPEPAQDAPEEGNGSSAAESGGRVAEESGASGGGSAEATPTETAAPSAAAALLAESGARLWCGAEGFLCLTKAGAASADAQALLLRLFADEEGIAMTRRLLRLQPFGELFPRTALAAQVADATAGAGSAFTVRGSALERAKESLGAYLAAELMGRAEWGEEQREGFLSAARLALGGLLAPPAAPPPAAE